MSKNESLPESRKLESMLLENKKKNTFGRKLKRFLRAVLAWILVPASIVILIIAFILPVFTISGTGMEPTLMKGEVVVCVKDKDIAPSDIIGINFSGKMLVKRCIAFEHQIVNIDEEGHVYIDDVLLPEPYVSNPDLGDCDIEFPFEVPETTIFVLGDKRNTSLDSRNSSVYCISKEELVGKVLFRIWPLSKFGYIEDQKG